MHNEQILSLICGSIFLRGGTRPAFWSWAQRSVVVLGASKRYGRPSRGGAGVSLLGGELGKCGPLPPSRGGASAVGSNPQVQAS